MSTNNRIIECEVIIIGRLHKLRIQDRTDNWLKDKRKRLLLPKHIIKLKEVFQKDNGTYYTFEYEVFQGIIAHTDDGADEQGYYGFAYKESDSTFYNFLERHKPYPTIQKALNNTILNMANLNRQKVKYKSINDVKYKIV